MARQAIPSPARPARRALQRVATPHRHELQHPGSSAGMSWKAGHIVAEQLARAQADRVEHVLRSRAVRDGALDPGEPLEQLLPLLEAVEQALVELRLHLRLAPLAASLYLRGEPEHAQRQAERVRHAARGGRSPRR